MSGRNVFKVANVRDLKEIIEEMSIAERNFDVIMDTAEEMIKTTLLFHDLKNPSEMIQPLRELVGQLKVIFAFIRRDLKLQYPSVNIGPGQIAHAAAERPIIEPNDFKRQATLCPLVLFFRIIAQGLSAYKIQVRENSWGPIRPLYDLLLRLQSRILDYTPLNFKPFWPGLATCIMFHEQDSTFTIASSSPRYQYLLGIHSLAKAVRKDHILRLRSRAGQSDKVKINNVERFCKEVTKDKNQNPFQQDGNRAQVDGVGATFNPSGAYMAACFLDFWRFQMPRPPAARMEEVLEPAREIYGVDSCSEWELWMIKVTKLKIMPRAVLRNHPLIETRETFPPRTSNSKPPPRRTTAQA